jgi:zinc transport system substrate-binding protein
MPYKSQNCWRNIMRNPRLILLVGLLLGVLGGCSDAATQPEPSVAGNERLSVVVTSLPLLQMTSAVAGDLADVTLIVPPSEASRTWNPSAEAVATMQSADLILISGAGYEPWRNRVSLPMSRVVDTASGYYSQFIRIPDVVTHQHGPDGEHSHAGTVWATWLDPQLAAAQLDRVAQELSKRDPAHADQFRQNEIPMKSQLEQLDGRLVQLSEDCAKTDFRFLSDLPYYQYLTRRFDRPLTYLHWPDSGDPLSEDQRAKFQEFAADDPPIVLLIRANCTEDQRQFAGSQPVEVVSIDLDEQITDNSDGLVERMKSNVDNLESAIQSLQE